MSLACKHIYAVHSVINDKQEIKNLTVTLKMELLKNQVHEWIILKIY